VCGIAGVAPLGGAAPSSIDQLRAMCDTLVHRGPDAEGLDVRCGVGLGMRRLAIIDLAGGDQPLWNEDETVRLVFNGEIYNFRELRSRLEARGHRFRSGSDGEVIVHLWEDEGPACLARLNGMFALALHDTRRDQLFLARDHTGIKPLYTAVTPSGHLVFGSEPKALLASGHVGRSLDLDALGEFIAWEYVPAPRTLFREIRKLPPATYLLADLQSGALHQQEWWDIPRADPSAHPPTRPSALADELDAALTAAVRSQLVADVPLGAFLSGGVDSSLVAAAMGREARTFSIGFDDPTYDELRWSEQVAAHLGMRHTTEVVRPDVAALFDTLMPFMDDPIGDFSIFPTHLVSRLARRDVTVALSGDGGDELFGGYETYIAEERARLWHRVPGLLRRGLVEPAIARLAPRPAKKGLVNKAKRFVEGLEHPAALAHARWRLFMGESLRRELFTPDALGSRPTPLGHHVERLFEAAGNRDQLDRMLYVDMRSYLSDNCLVKVDRMSMACSLEARVPFLDPDVVALAFRLPARLKVRGGSTKVLLKEVAARHVPRSAVYRAKQGFSMPMKHWLGSEFRPLVDDLLSPARLASEGVIRGDTVARLKAEHFAGRANHSHLLWGLLVFQDWRMRWGV
jgi:asparagine synthase (glutamine-hydrolysing)